MIRFVIPAAPSVNALYRNVSAAEREKAMAHRRVLRGRRRTKAYSAWKTAAGWAMRLDGQRTRSWGMLEGPVEVEIVVGTNRQDNDNAVKAIFDLMTEMRVWADDSQVVAHSVRRGGEPGKTIVTIQEARNGKSVAT